jgi:hypothetical protein
MLSSDEKAQASDVRMSNNGTTKAMEREPAEIETEDSCESVRFWLDWLALLIILCSMSLILVPEKSRHSTTIATVLGSWPLVQLSINNLLVHLGLNEPTVTVPELYSDRSCEMA